LSVWLIFFSQYREKGYIFKALRLIYGDKNMDLGENKKNLLKIIKRIREN